MKYGSLFSGIGGMDLGLDRAGLSCAWQVERDPWCQRVLAKHWPHVPRFGEVRDVGRDNLDTVDVIAGGPPCQPFSDAGQRRGAADDRNLWPEMRRIVQELQPRWVVVENVPGIIGLYLETILFDLEAEGYEAWAFVLPACAFGALHIRSRVFVLAYANREWQLQPQGRIQDKRGWLGDYRSAEECGQSWPPEPGVGRVADGIPNRLDRLRGLGNAVVPQVAEWIGRRLIQTTWPAAHVPTVEAN